MVSGSMRFAATIAVLATLTHGCGGGSGAESEAPLAINHHPFVRMPNPDQSFAVDHPFDYDVLQRGTTFVDPDGDALSYSVNMIDGPLGMNVSGTRIAGPATETGVVIIEVIAEDDRSASARDSFEIRINPNSVPTVVHPNPHLLVAVGENINHDATQAGTTFRDVDGDPLTYQMTIEGNSQAMTATGSHVVGSMLTVGLARVRISATDGYGGVGENEFSIAAPTSEPGEPALPVVPYTYADDELPLPYVYRELREFGWPFEDTTPSDNETTNAGAKLGRVLFYDKRLSITNTHSCATCHKQALAFGSPDRFSVGVIGVPLRRHAMPLSNVRFNRDNRYFSDMRVASLEQLVQMPIEEPRELGQPLELLEAKLASTVFYPPLFEAAFGDPEINRTRISRAIAQFLRSMISYRSRFDRAHYTTDPQVPVEPGNELTEQEQRGFDVFIASRCHFCHRVPAHNIGRPANNGLDETITDPGTIEGLGWFRAPSIRNVAVSAPYMHDGRFATLREVIDHYDSGVKMNLGLDSMFLFNGEVRRLELTEEDKAALEAFLNSLTDREFLSDPKFSDPFPP
jgi:cytochrome c peroxidase